MIELPFKEYSIFSGGLVIFGTISLVYIITKKLLIQSKKEDRKYPPSIGSFPVIGSWPYLPDITVLHQWSLEKSYKLGGVFSYKSGRVYSVLLNSHEAIREAFIHRSVDYADRPNHCFTQIMAPEGKGLSLRSYDAVYKKYRKQFLSILKEFGYGQRSIETKIWSEVEVLIKHVKSMNGLKFDPKESLGIATQNIITGIAFGKPTSSCIEVEDRLALLIHDLHNLFASLLVLDEMPSLCRLLPYFQKKVNNASVVMNEVFALIDKKIDEALCPEADQSFVSCFVEDEENEKQKFDRLQLNLTILDLLVGGSETVSSMILWAIVLLTNHPDVQKRLQKEIDSVVSRDRPPSLGDMTNMTYVEATILEVMRCKTIGPLGQPRQTMRDTEVGGFFIPKGAHVYSVLYAAHMDVNVWGDPTEFRPERFLDAAGNIINKDRVIPFSLGKRSCPGELLSRQEVFLFLTGLVQQFHFRPSEGSDTIDCKEQFEGVMLTSPFEVRFLQRN